MNSARYLKGHTASTGKLGATGFCFGGGIVNHLAVTLGADLAAGVPFYGAAAPVEDVQVMARPLEGQSEAPPFQPVTQPSPAPEAAGGERSGVMPWLLGTAVAFVVGLLVGGRDRTSAR